MADTESKEPLTSTVSLYPVENVLVVYQNPQGADGEAENEPQFEPVIKLEQQVETKTHEEDEEVSFKM